MNRLLSTLARIRKENKKALSVFVTAGYPDLDATPRIVSALEQSGTDIIELGIPFSDPLADGPVIQQSSDRALKNGVTVERVFEMVRTIRRSSFIPLVLMGYTNPIFAYGLERFITNAAAEGVDGVIIPDLPLEEAGEYRSLAEANDISSVFLAAPTTGTARLRQLDEASNGFLYCVSITGVTGIQNGRFEKAIEFLQRCKSQALKNPVLVGFGISRSEDVGLLAPHVDGIIVGSALISLIARSETNSYLMKIQEFTRELRSALNVC